MGGPDATLTSENSHFLRSGPQEATLVMQRGVRTIAKVTEWLPWSPNGGTVVATVITQWTLLVGQSGHNSVTRKAEALLKLMHNVHNSTYFYGATNGRPLCIHSAITAMCVRSSCLLWATCERPTSLATFVWLFWTYSKLLRDHGDVWASCVPPLNDQGNRSASFLPPTATWPILWSQLKWTPSAPNQNGPKIWKMSISSSCHLRRYLVSHGVLKMWQSSWPASLLLAGLTFWPRRLERWLTTLSGLSTQVEYQWFVGARTLQNWHSRVFRVIPTENPATRWGILSTVSSLCDPMGMAAPYVLTGKSIVQDFCQLKLTWDECVLDDLHLFWTTIVLIIVISQSPSGLSNLIYCITLLMQVSSDMDVSCTCDWWLSMVTFIVLLFSGSLA